jgi:hypothetical protein
VGQLVDQGYLGASAQDRGEVHLLQAPAPVLDHLPGDDLQAIGQFLGMRPPIGLDEPGHHVGAPRLPSVALGEHGVGLADAGGRAEVDAEMTGRLDLVGGVCITGHELVQVGGGLASLARWPYRPRHDSLHTCPKASSDDERGQAAHLPGNCPRGRENL